MTIDREKEIVILERARESFLGGIVYLKYKR
jgi:hypothetical protein